MPRVKIHKSVPIERTARVQQLEGLFDVPRKAASEFSLDLDVRLDADRPWNIGLIVGPSGCGKTTIANHLFGEHYVAGYEWPHKQAIVDAFPKALGIKDITGLLSSVGFSSPPHWLRPFHVLSNGEQFRATVARALAEQPAMACVDEFTSVVDRQVAQVASAAVAKAVRARGMKFVAVSCHYDIAEWLQPDWVIDLAERRFEWRCLQRRPPIDLVIEKADQRIWPTFAHHHYLSARHAKSAHWFLATVDRRPAACAGVIFFPHPQKPGFREHRLVTLPDFQGVGIGNHLSAYVASLFVWKGPYHSVTSHPAMIQHRCRSKLWTMIRKPSMCSVAGGQKKLAAGRVVTPRVSARGNNRIPGAYSNDRMTAGFVYVGPRNDEEARHFGLMA